MSNITSHRTWKHAILNDPNHRAIEESSAEIVTILKSDPAQVPEGEKLLRLVALQSSLSTILLSLNPFNDKIMGSFAHEPFGLCFDTPDVEGQVKCIALTGFGEQATPVYIDTETLFRTTADAFNVPTIQAFLSFHVRRNAEDLGKLTAEVGNALPVNLVAVLPPSLAHIATDHGVRETIKGDAWFGSVKAVVNVCFNEQQQHVRNAVFQLKNNRKGYPKKFIEEQLRDTVGGTKIVLKATCPKTGLDLVAIGYKYNNSKVLFFVSNDDAGSTTDGEPYHIKFSDQYGNVVDRQISRPEIISKFFAQSNCVDVHNQLRQYGLRLEKKNGLRQSHSFDCTQH